MTQTQEREPVVIAAAVRTPIGSFGGALGSMSATDLGAAAVRGRVVLTRRGRLLADAVVRALTA